MKPMKINGHPFPTNMVEVNDPGNKGKAKVLTSEQARPTGAVIPRCRYRLKRLKADTSRGKVPRDLIGLSHPRSYWASTSVGKIERSIFRKKGADVIKIIDGAPSSFSVGLKD
jgi:hypothetical protein